MNINIPARIEKGKLVWENPVLLTRQLSALNGKEVNVVIKQKGKSRSKNQNDYYFGVVIEILAQQTGYSVDEMHEVMKAKFLSETRELAGESITVSKSTTSLTTVDFEKYLSDIREWASVYLECYIPLPNEVSY